MDHVVYLDAQAKELISLLSGSKTMILRGATGRKLPHGRVDQGDVLYFINNNAEGMDKQVTLFGLIVKANFISDDLKKGI